MPRDDDDDILKQIQAKAKAKLEKPTPEVVERLIKGVPFAACPRKGPNPVSRPENPSRVPAKPKARVEERAAPPAEPPKRSFHEGPNPFRKALPAQTEDDAPYKPQSKSQPTTVTVFGKTIPRYTMGKDEAWIGFGKDRRLSKWPERSNASASDPNATTALDPDAATAALAAVDRDIERMNLRAYPLEEWPSNILDRKQRAELDALICSWWYLGAWQRAREIEVGIDVLEDRIRRKGPELMGYRRQFELNQQAAAPSESRPASAVAQKSPMAAGAAVRAEAAPRRREAGIQGGEPCAKRARTTDPPSPQYVWGWGGTPLAAGCESPPEALPTLGLDGRAA